MSRGAIEQRVGLAERLIAHGLVLAGGAVILWETASLSSQSARFPTLIGWGLIVLSLLSMAATLRARAVWTEEAPLTKGALGLGLLAGFVFSSQHAGFLTSVLWFLPAFALLAGERSASRLAVTTIAFTALAYLFFHLLFAQSLSAEWILGEV